MPLTVAELEFEGVRSTVATSRGAHHAVANRGDAEQEGGVDPSGGRHRIGRRGHTWRSAADEPAYQTWKSWLRHRTAPRVTLTRSPAMPVRTDA